MCQAVSPEIKRVGVKRSLDGAMPERCRSDRIERTTAKAAVVNRKSEAAAYHHRLY